MRENFSPDDCGSEKRNFQNSCRDPFLIFNLCQRSIDSQTLRDGKVCEESRYYISSRRPNARKLATFSRRHWSIENNLHWVLDVSFHEDLCRLRTGHSPENLALLNRIAVSLLKADQTVKAGIACKRKTAGWDDNYLIQLLLNNPSY